MSFHGGADELALVMKGTGDYYRLKGVLRSRLYECGWVDQIHLLCAEARKDSNSSVNELYSEVSKKAADLVPVSLKKELLLRVKEQLRSIVNYNDNDADTTQTPGKK